MNDYYFVGYPLAIITERSRRGIDVHRFRIYPTGSDVQILHTESIKLAGARFDHCNVTLEL